jgi:hypothetical protein
MLAHTATITTIVLPAQLRDRSPKLRLLQNPTDLLERKSLLLHSKVSVALNLAAELSI